MTAQEHLRRLRRLERIGQALTCSCVIPLLLSFIYARAQDYDAAWMWFGVFALLYFVDRFLFYRAREHLECIGEQFKELFP